MKTNEMTINTCAKCGKEYKGRGAVSRVDNLTVICPDCGTREALESIGVDKVEQDKILGVIHKNFDSWFLILLSYNYIITNYKCS